MLGEKEVAAIIEKYDQKNLGIAAIGSHSALDLCLGAKKFGLKTVVVCEKGRERTYAQHYKAREGRGIVDKVILVDKFKDVLKEEVQEELRKENAVFLPNRSFEVYIGFDYGFVENNFLVPLFGTRELLKTEERNAEKNQYYLMQKAGIRFPKRFGSAKEIDGLAIVKASEAERKFERKFFFASSEKEYLEKGKRLVGEGAITQQQLEEAIIEEYVLGVQTNFNYFYSPLSQELELLGTDTRRQTNFDGLLRTTCEKQTELLEKIYPTFEEAGHISCTVLESMLEKAFALGEGFVEATKKEFPPGIIGPFALQSCITAGPPKKGIVVFDVSCRIPGSPGTKYTPYSAYLHREEKSFGERICQEIKEAADSGRLLEVVT